MQEPKNLNPASPQSCMKGLDNLGQTCFFNAAVQCILFSPNSTNYFLKCAPDLNPKRKGASTVSQAFVDLARSYWNSGAQGEVADVRPVYDAFCKATRSFKPGQQHDAHEAMVCMLDKLHEGLSRLKPGDLGVAKDPSICGAEWTSSLKQECSIVSEVFRGQIRVTVQGEGYTSVTYDHFTTLSLAVNEASALSGCVQRFMAPETVPDFKEGDKTMQVTLTKAFTYLPRILVMHLKRFDGSATKLDKFVDYPFELSLSTYAASEHVHHHYQLFAVCLHRGTESEGHYAACCEANGMWFLLDDQSSQRMENINHVIQRDAYILMYKRL